MADSVSVHIPTALRAHVDDKAQVDLEAGTIREILDRLVEKHPGLRGRLLDDGGELNKFVNVYVNDEDIRFLENLSTPVKEGDALTIVPSIAGG
jgi:molybdopterin converting factor small subunit